MPMIDAETDRGAHLLPPELHAVLGVGLCAPPVAQHAKRIDPEAPPREHWDGVSPVVGVRAKAMDKNHDRPVVVGPGADVVAVVPLPRPPLPSLLAQDEALHAIDVLLARRQVESRGGRGGLRRNRRRNAAAVRCFLGTVTAPQRGGWRGPQAALDAPVREGGSRTPAARTRTHIHEAEIITEAGY